MMLYVHFSVMFLTGGPWVCQCNGEGVVMIQSMYVVR